MTQDLDAPTGSSDPGRRAARRVATSRADRKAGRTSSAQARPPKGGARKRGKRRLPQPGKTVFRVITASLLSLGLLTGIGVVLVYNNWNGNIYRTNIDAQLKNRPEKEKTGPTGPLNILVMGSDSRAGEGNGIDGASTNGLSDTTILFHLSENREYAYGISIPRDTAVIRPTCYEEDGSEIAGSGGYVKWNEAFATGGPACTVQQFEQLTDVRIDKFVVVDFNQFKDMVDALDGVEVCIPEDINDEVRDIYLKAGTREVKGDEALTYVRARYRIGDGTDPNRTRRQQAFIGSMINKALNAGMVTRPDKLIDFMNAASSSLQTDFKSFAQMARIGVSAQGIGASNIKFITTPWVYSDKVSSGIEWTPEVEQLWNLVRTDRPLGPAFLKDALSAGDKPDGTPTAPQAPADQTEEPSDTPTPSEQPSAPAGSGTPAAPGTGTPLPDGLSAEGREAAGLCT